MPPEPLPWDRKELRKHDGGGGGGGSGGLGFAGPRWREAPFPQHHPYNHHHNNHHHGGAPPRWLPDFRYRPPLGHGKQGGRHLYLDDLGHGFMTSRPNEKMVEDESCRPSGSGRYGRSSRESRGSFCQKDWKGHSSDTSSLPNGLGRPNNTSDQRSVDNMPSLNSSIPSSDSINSRDQSQPKDHHDINGAIGAVGSTGQKLERENSLNSIGWKPLKWTRSGSLSSRGSGFSHSSSSKSMAPESDKMEVELMPKNVTSTQSPLADAAASAAACVTLVAPSEETNSRKKPRLGWGEGLAKYEKKKVEGADDSALKNGATDCGSNSEPGHCQSSNLTDKSTRVVGFSDCASPATPSSVACSSSPGVEEKLVKAGSVDHDCANLCSSPSVLSQNHSAGSTFNLENLDLALFSHLNLSMNELLQSDDPVSVDSGFVGSTAMNKLLVLKNDLSKVLEATESEIDLLENELKSLISEPESSYPCLAASGSVPAECDSKPCEDHSAASSITLRPAALELVPSGCVIVEDAVNAPNDDHAALRDDVDSPSSATSKFVQLPSSGKDVCPPDVLKDVEDFMDPDVKKSGDLEVECSMDGGLNEEKAVGMSSPGVGSQLTARSSATATSDDNLQSGREEIPYELILASNKDLAHSSSEVINKLLPTSEYHIDISSVDSASCLENDSVKGRFLRRKRFLQLKERIITLKFKMFQHLWKEDMRLLSLKKLRAKSQKKFDFSLRTVNSGSQKHRSSIRSRYASTAASLSLEPATEMISYASKLLSDPQVKPHRNVLKMPVLILDKQERMASRFISSNGLVEDMRAFEKERSMLNPWTSEEKKIFLEKFAIFDKDFRKIASFLDYKTTADCIEFYYKNHKSDSFEKTKKKPDFEKRAKSCSANTYLLASGKRWNREANAVSLDLLGAATAIAAKIDDGVKIQQNCTPSSFFAVSNSYRMPRGDGLLERSNSMDLYNDERETVAADVLAGICGSLSSEAMSSCITSSVDPGDGYQEWKYQRAGSSTRWPLTPEVTQNVDDETCSDESCGEMDPTDWTDEEKFLFIQAVSSYGRDFAMISRCVRTRSRDQCKVFFSKARKCLGLDMICPGPGNLVIDDANGGGSDMEDACVVETGSVICSEKSGFKMDVDIQSPDNKLKPDPEQVGMTKPDLNKVEDDNEVGDMDSADTMLMSKNLIPDDCQMEGKPEVDFDPNSGIGNGVCAELISVQVQDNLLRNSDLKAAQSVGGANNHNLPNGPGSEARRADANAAYVEDLEAKLEGQGLLLREGNLNVDKVVKGESSSSDINGMRCSLQDKQSEAQVGGNDSHSTADTSSSGFQRQTDLELNSTRKPRVIAPLENNFSVPLDAGSKVSATTKHGKSPDDSSVDIGKISDEHRAKASRTTEQHLSGHSAVEHLESSNILRGYPVPVSTIKEMSGDISCKKSIQFQSSRVSDGTNFGQYLARDSYLQGCNSSSKPVSSGAELSLASEEKLRDCSRPTSDSASDVDKPCSNGDVKLFGQILSKPSQQKLNTNAQRNEDNSTQHHDVGGKSSKVKNSSNQAADVHSAPAKYNHSNFVGSENLALRSFDFWDRNRMQNGFSSMPDSAILLGKYPSAFGNYAMPSSKMDPVPFHGVGKNGECSLNSVSVFPTRDIGDSNALADFQVYRNHEMQPFTIDMRQRRDILFSEMNRRSGFDVVSGMQQQSRGMVGINVVGRGGVLVGGQCTSISDPVAAIRMHYAKAEQFSGQAGNMIRDDESWRGKGNIGSR